MLDYAGARSQQACATRRSSTRSGPRVYLPPSSYEAWFVSAVHDDAVLDRVADALPEAARAAAAATEEADR